MSVRRLAPADIQPSSFAFTPENDAWMDAQIAKYPEGRQASVVIPALWQAQKQHDGWLPKPAIEAVAKRLGMPLIRVMEVATFYTMFNLEPVGRWFIQLCGTVPCHVKGALDLKQVLLERIGDPRHVTADGNFAWLEVECLGACCNAPMVQINDDYYEDLTPDLLIKLMDDLAAGRSVKPGPQNGRLSSEPEGGATTLTDESLFDGSVVGAWKARFEEQLGGQGGTSPAATGETGTATATGPGDPKAAKPDSGRAAQSPAADAPAQRAANGEAPVKSSDRRDADGASPARPASTGQAPESVKSYAATPAQAKPDGSSSAPQPRRDGAESKPVGADPDASPGVAPKR